MIFSPVASTADLPRADTATLCSVHAMCSLCLLASSESNRAQSPPFLCLISAGTHLYAHGPFCRKGEPEA